MLQSHHLASSRKTPCYLRNPLHTMRSLQTLKTRDKTPQHGSTK